MKLIFITDTHGRGSNPGSRLDDYPQTVLNKFAYINTYARDIGASGIIHGGDWLETPDVTNVFIRRLVNVVRHSSCPWYGILGNHDIYGYNPDTFAKTPLGIAEEAGMFTRLFRDNPVEITDGETKVYLTGTDSHFDLDKEDTRYMYMDSARKEGHINIHVTHGMLLHKEWPQLKHTVIDDIKDFNADILLSGHEHVGYGLKRLDNGKLVCNPGSLLRVTASTGDIRKDVRFAVITVTGTEFDIELVNMPVSIARPASEVIDIEKLQNEKDSKQKLEAFVDMIGDVELDEDFDVMHNLGVIAESVDASEEVIEECRTRIQEAEEQLKKSE